MMTFIVSLTRQGGRSKKIPPVHQSSAPARPPRHRPARSRQRGCQPLTEAKVRQQFRAKRLLVVPKSQSKSKQVVNFAYPPPAHHWTGWYSSSLSLVLECGVSKEVLQQGGERTMTYRGIETIIERTDQKLQYFFQNWFCYYWSKLQAQCQLSASYSVLRSIN